MRRFASFAAIFLLLITAAPVLACVTGGSMSQAESACCHAMHGRCDGAMAKMGCCRLGLRADASPQLASVAPLLPPAQIFIERMVPVVTSTPGIPPAILRSPDEHSPPGLLIATLTVLRL